MEREKTTIVMGVLADTHVLGSKLLTMALEDEGFKVVHIGALVTQDEFVKAALETNAKAIFVSTSSGHGEVDCEGLRGKCEEAGLKDILLYVGGNVVVGLQLRKWEEVERKFKEMGFDRVCPPDTRPDQVVSYLKEDLERQPSRNM
jgi:methylaspartate mutase sigma subunit